jgi:hypothetical protein
VGSPTGSRAREEGVGSGIFGAAVMVWSDMNRLNNNVEVIILVRLLARKLTLRVEVMVCIDLDGV